MSGVCINLAASARDALQLRKWLLQKDWVLMPEHLPVQKPRRFTYFVALEKTVRTASIVEVLYTWYEQGSELIVFCCRAWFDLIGKSSF